jgi:hypothetical protein
MAWERLGVWRWRPWWSIRAMILGSAACSNKYLCFDRSINLGTIPVHKVSECSLHWHDCLCKVAWCNWCLEEFGTEREQKHPTYVNMQIINLCYKILYGLYDVYKSTFWRKHTTCTYSSYIIGFYFTLPCLLKCLLAQN